MNRFLFSVPCSARIDFTIDADTLQEAQAKAKEYIKKNSNAVVQLGEGYSFVKLFVDENAQTTGNCYQLPVKLEESKEA